MCPLSSWSLFMTVLWFVYCETLQDNFVQIDLHDGRVSGYSPYISFVEPPKHGRRGSCSHQVVLKVDFSGKYHGAKILLDYNEPPKLWTLDISDSPTGDGYGGDNGTTSNMAETQIHNKQLRIYGNLLPGHMDASSNGGLLITTVDDFIKKGSRAKIDISDERIEWKSGRHKDFLESKFLYTLSGQTPAYGVMDYFVYVGLNRVVAGDFRSGSGLCRVSISLYSLPGNACERGTHSCHKDALCINTKRRYKCNCKPGYYGTGKICVEKDECTYEDNGGCVHFCQNTIGNYTCSCKDGFMLARDGHNCIDKNECLENLGGCNHQCSNTLGGYECKCNQGYSLTTDGTTCQYGTWCQENLGCAHYCHTPGGRLVCGCRQGYRLHSNGKDCIQTCAAANGGCQHICTDTSTGPNCSCAQNYILRDDNRTCIASCEVNNGGCDQNCIDSNDGPTCSCPRGFKLHQDRRTCLDQNECSENNGGCSHDCVNNIGSYECVCPKGYKVGFNEKTCTDVNECEINTCDHLCVNTPGSFYCVCRTGYQLYGITHCTDKYECSVNKGGCQYQCQNTPGSYHCLCPNGQKLHENGKDCVDFTTCQSLQTPAKSTLRCTVHAGNQVCNVTCDANTFPTLSHNDYSYTCGPQTSYQWSYEQQNMTLPTCSASVDPPNVKGTAKFVFIASRCRTKRRIREELRRNITDQLNGQKKYKCRKSCSINHVNIDCSPNKKYMRFVKGTNFAVVSAEMELELAPTRTRNSCNIACVKKRTERRLKKMLKKMRRSVNKKQFYIRYDRKETLIIKRSFKFRKRLEYSCPDGSVFVDGQCVACSIGTYYKRKLKTCIHCPRGTYQNEEGQLNCIKCNKKLPGVGILGAKDITDCSVQCEPGTFSRDGLKPCQPCAVGYYQTYYGRTSCMLCGGGLTTRGEGSKTFKNCLARITCSPGHFYNLVTHTCDRCPIGTYQSDAGQNYCEACPGTTSTDFPATVNMSECKDMACGGNIGRLQGYIQSPNYPGNYPNNVECIWKIKPGKKRRILVIIPEIFISKEDNCGDSLVLRKSKKPTSLTTYETCESSERPIAFTSSTKRMWVKFKSDAQNTAGGFSIPFVTYNEDYQRLIEDIVTDGRLYSSYQHQSILKDRKLLNLLMEVIAQPRNYFKYYNISGKMMPESFIRLLTSKVQTFFTSED